MSFATYLHALQNKPEPVRKRIFFIILTVAMLIVIGTWLATIRATVLNPNQPQEIKSSPFTEMKLLFLETSEAVKTGWTKFKE